VSPICGSPDLNDREQEDCDAYEPCVAEMDAGGVADRICIFELCARTGSARIEDEDRGQHLSVLLLRQRTTAVNTSSIKRFVEQPELGNSWRRLSVHTGCETRPNETNPS